VVIEGEAGIGKTRLADELAGHARSLGASVVRGRCYEEEAGVAYGPFIEGLRSVLAAGPSLDQVPRHWLAEASRLLPELVEAYPGLPEPGPLDGPAAGRQFFEGVSQVLLAATAGPVPGLLVVDDLQWADEASLDVLAYLVHRLEGRPLLVVACWRSEQVPADARLRRLAAETRRAGRGSVLELSRLDAAGVAELVAAVAPARAGAAGLLHERTEGLPFLVLEYLAAVGEDGELPALLPGGARDLLAARVRGVGDAARQVLATAAVLGRSFEVDTARAASGRSDEEAVAALEELAARGLVHEVAGDVYDFGHGLVRDLVYEQTSLARRRLLHRRVGEALAAAARGRRPQEPPAASIARHLELGGAPAEAAGYHRLAGDQARAVFANREALGHYRAAAVLGHPDPAGLHAAIGDLETLLGNYDAALAAYTEAAGAAEDGDRWVIEQKLGAVSARRGDWDAAERHLTAALAALGSAGAEARRAGLAADRSLAAHRQGRDDAAEQLARDALDLAAEAGDAGALARPTACWACSGRPAATTTTPAATWSRAWPWPRPCPTPAPGSPPSTTWPSPTGRPARSTWPSSTPAPPWSSAPARATATARPPSTTTWPTCSTWPATMPRPWTTSSRRWRSSPRSASPAPSNRRSGSSSPGDRGCGKLRRWPGPDRRQALTAGVLGAAAALAGGAGLVQAGVLPAATGPAACSGPATSAARRPPPWPPARCASPASPPGGGAGRSATRSPGRPGRGRVTGCRSSCSCTPPPATERTPFDRLRLHHHLAEAVGAGGARRSPWPRPTAGTPAGGPGPVTIPSPWSPTSWCRLLSGLGLRTGPGGLACSAGRPVGRPPCGWPRATPAGWSPWPWPARP
jgi:tetratricopeptide (TPR) repeat protein